ncbi:MAG: hypothetical protein J6X49_02070 [Victivallales bacterium]|nr:hypothetical protein [Victivallales bacterium]
MVVLEGHGTTREKRLEAALSHVFRLSANVLIPVNRRPQPEGKQAVPLGVSVVSQFQRIHGTACVILKLFHGVFALRLPEVAARLPLTIRDSSRRCYTFSLSSVRCGLSASHLDAASLKTDRRQTLGGERA